MNKQLILASHGFNIFAGLGLLLTLSIQLDASQIVVKTVPVQTQVVADGTTEYEFDVLGNTTDCLDKKFGKRPVNHIYNLVSESGKMAP